MLAADAMETDLDESLKADVGLEKVLVELNGLVMT